MIKKIIHTDKDLIAEWRNHWKNDSVENGLKQIAYEDNYRYNFRKFFKAGDKILEAGCGLGRYCFWLEDRGIKTIGIDIVKEAIDLGREYAKAKGYKTKLFIGDVRKLPFENDSFDGYISLGVIEHFRKASDIQKTFLEAYRILKPGGYAYISVPNPMAIHMILEKLIYSLKLNSKLYHKPVFETNLVDFARSVNFTIIKIRTHDFYFPFYSLIRSLFRRDIFPLKTLMKNTLNFFDQVPILRNFGSGIAITLQKPNEN